MAFVLGANSLKRLGGVHPDLVRVVKRAITITPIDFAVVQGRRTKDEQMRLYGKGRTAAQCRAAGVPVHYAQPNADKVTNTLNSNHLEKSDGYGHAIDFAPYVNGALVMPARPTKAEEQMYRDIANAFKKAAMHECVVIGWGGDWKSPVDMPHIELLPR